MFNLIRQIFGVHFCQVEWYLPTNYNLRSFPHFLISHYFHLLREDNGNPAVFQNNLPHLLIDGM